MLVDDYGRKLDDLDTLKLRIAARDLGAAGESYAVVAADETPICGFLKHGDTQASFGLVATQWKHTANEEPPHACQ